MVQLTLCSLNIFGYFGKTKFVTKSLLKSSNLVTLQVALKPDLAKYLHFGEILKVFGQLLEWFN